MDWWMQGLDLGHCHWISRNRFFHWRGSQWFFILLLLVNGYAKCDSRKLANFGKWCVFLAWMLMRDDDGNLECNWFYLNSCFRSQIWYRSSSLAFMKSVNSHCLFLRFLMSFDCLWGERLRVFIFFLPFSLSITC